MPAYSHGRPHVAALLAPYGGISTLAMANFALAARSAESMWLVRWDTAVSLQCVFARAE